MRIEINRPKNKLARTTAINKNNVFNNKVKTSHDCKKLVKLFEKFAKRQNI